ncbi:hypothetical protein [Halalkalibacter krulwichiae]|uniref:Uncharacterized protein n=1 Tax=Halalkalibacter krulwichiae TaxID=199441 RepID=A0A1X9MD24_9BACI|nr:hypothetical protein [Halalkalibacter krulwichiae]ARK30460.1 hypothetical protein BkAM31D_11825 [Halalkalibacter krulwichiae]
MSEYKENDVFDHVRMGQGTMGLFGLTGPDEIADYSLSSKPKTTGQIDREYDGATATSVETKQKPE